MGCVLPRERSAPELVLWQQQRRLHAGVAKVTVQGSRVAEVACQECNGQNLPCVEWRSVHGRLVHVLQFCRALPATIPHIASGYYAFGNRKEYRFTCSNAQLRS